MDVDQPNSLGDASNYILTSTPCEGAKPDFPMSVEYIRSGIPRSIGPPFTQWTPRIGNQYPGVGIMIQGLSEDTSLSTHTLKDLSSGIIQSAATSESSPAYLDDTPSDESATPEWSHQFPQPAFGLPPSNSFSQPISDTTLVVGGHRNGSQAHVHSPCPLPCKRKGGRRWGYRLSKAGAKNAKYVRQHGSCWHCFLMKKKVCLSCSYPSFRTV